MPKGIPKNGINNGWFKKTAQETWKVCENCGKRFYRLVDKNGYLLSKTIWNKRRFCSIKCHSGEHHIHWKGGILPEVRRIRASTQFGKWRGKVFERDDYTCRLCGKRGGRLHANHIKKFSDYPALRFDADNGITLCKICHTQMVNNHETEWESYFNFILINKLGFREVVYK